MLFTLSVTPPLIVPTKLWGQGNLWVYCQLVYVGIKSLTCWHHYPAINRLTYPCHNMTAAPHVYAILEGTGGRNRAGRKGEGSFSPMAGGVAGVVVVVPARSSGGPSAPTVCLPLAERPVGSVHGEAVGTGTPVLRAWPGPSVLGGGGWLVAMSFEVTAVPLVAACSGETSMTTLICLTTLGTHTHTSVMPLKGHHHTAHIQMQIQTLLPYVPRVGFLPQGQMSPQYQSLGRGTVNRMRAWSLPSGIGP